MIAMQTKALFVDAYRDLNARKMFWVVLVLNALVVAGFSALGVRGNRLTVFTWQIPLDVPFALVLYKWIFSYVVVGRWLTWAATILALISTASIFPDFMAGGAIELYLSKPIGRLRLFLTKYISGLLFVILQVSVFTVGSFLVLGWRGHVWEPGLFLAIPIVVLFFSYLFSISVLLGVLTRSTLAAFFLTLVAWFLIFGINQADAFMMQADEMYKHRAQDSQRRLARIDAQISELETSSTRPATTQSILGWLQPSDSQKLARLKVEREGVRKAAEETEPPSWVKTAQPILFALNTLVPKTQDTIGLLDRVLFSDSALQTMASTAPQRGPGHGWREQVERLLHGRSVAWILASSIAFELAMLGLASWRFAKRDY